MSTTPKTSLRSAQGFTFVELLVAIGVSLVVMAAAASVFQKSAETSNLVMQRLEVQSELRSAANQLARDLDQAGTAVPDGGISIPSAATGGTNPRFACDSTTCYLSTNNTLTQGVLNKVVPANGAGPNILQPTDAIVLSYLDPLLDWRAYPTTTAASNGTTLTMPAGTTPPINDPAVGLAVGDVLFLQNANGNALGVVTSFNPSTRVISFANGDPLIINQSGATVGNIKALRYSPVPASPPYYPAITVSRLMLITYFVQQVNTPEGPSYRLMRQVGARTPVVVAENIEDLQFTYDLFDDSTNNLTANLPDAVTGSPPSPKPNQIRKINITITARSPRRNAQGQFDRISYTTSLGPRNLSFRDRYN